MDRFQIHGADTLFTFNNRNLKLNVTNGSIEFGWGTGNLINNKSLITASGAGADVSFTIFDHAGNATGSATVDNTGGGTLSATGTNSSISFIGATVIGGTLETNAGSTIKIYLNNTFRWDNVACFHRRQCRDPKSPQRRRHAQSERYG